jgi:hypothetical protein
LKVLLRGGKGGESSRNNANVSCEAAIVDVQGALRISFFVYTE